MGKEGLVGTVVYEENTYRSTTRNTFYLIISETPRTVMLQRLDSIQETANGQRGMERASPKPAPGYDDPRFHIRARKNQPDEPGDYLWFSYKQQAFFIWDGKPRVFDTMD